MNFVFNKFITMITLLWYPYEPNKERPCTKHEEFSSNSMQANKIHIMLNFRTLIKKNKSSD